MSIWPNWTSRSDMSKNFLDHDLVDVAPVELGMPMRGADDAKPVLQVRAPRGFVVSSHIREDFLIPLLDRLRNRGIKQSRRHALPSALERHVRSQHADVIKRAGVARERLHALKPDNL